VPKNEELNLGELLQAFKALGIAGALLSVKDHEGVTVATLARRIGYQGTIDCLKRYCKQV
jgi:hypothetical protein